MQMEITTHEKSLFLSKSFDEIATCRFMASKFPKDNHKHLDDDSFFLLLSNAKLRLRTRISCYLLHN